MDFIEAGATGVIPLLPEPSKLGMHSVFCPLCKKTHKVEEQGLSTPLELLPQMADVLPLTPVT